MNRIGFGTCRIPFDTEQKIGIDQDTLNGRPDPRLESAGPAVLVQIQQRHNFFIGYWTAVSAPGECGENLLGAWFFICFCFRVASQYSDAAWRLSEFCRVIGPTDGD